MTPGGWFRLEFTLHDEWQLVDRVRAAVTASLAMVAPEETGELLAMVVSELLENALKYGDLSAVRHPPGAARLSMSGSAERVEIALEHPLPPDSPDAERLFAVLARMARAESQEAAYVEQLREVASRQGGAGGLGLARIAYEGQCQLAAALLEDGRLRLTGTVILAGPEVEPRSPPPPPSIGG